MPIAVNVDPRESDVASLSASDLNENLEGADITVVTSESDLIAAIDASRTGRSSWRYLLIAGFILLLLESLFAEFLRKRKRSRSKQADPIPDNLTGVQDA
jgi:hypothetical protein